jgi:hypothetical protein
LFSICLTELRASNGGTFTFDPNGTLTFGIAGWLTVGPGSAVGVNDIVLKDLGHVDVQGELSASSVLLDNGDVTVSGSLEVSQGYTLVKGATTLQGGSVTVGDLFDNQGGEMYGMGTIHGTFRNAGRLTVVSLTVDGDFTQTMTGEMIVWLRSTSDFAQMVVTGSARLDGTLTVTFASGYAPQQGDSFAFLQFSTGSGTFSHLNIPASRFGIFYVLNPDEGETGGVTLLF